MNEARILAWDSPYDEQDFRVHHERARTDKFYWLDVWRYRNSQRQEKQHVIECARSDKNYWLDKWKIIKCDSMDQNSIGGHGAYKIRMCILPGHEIVLNCEKCRYYNSMEENLPRLGGVPKDVQETVKTQGIQFSISREKYGDFYIFKADIKRMMVIFGNVSKSDAIKKLEDAILRS